MKQILIMLVPLMICLSGFIPLIVVKNFKERRAKLRYWQRAKAIVYDISYDNTDSESRCTVAYPKYRFSYGGNEYNGTISYGIHLGKYRVGDAIEIFFNPLDPDESDAPEYLAIGPFPLSSYDLIIYVFSIMSVLCFAMGICFLLFAHTIFT